MESDCGTKQSVNLPSEIIETHPLKNDGLRVLFYRSLWGPLWPCSLRSFLEKSIPARTRYLPEFDGRNSEIVGSCNGLVCILKDRTSFFLLNPSTRISKELPRMDNGNAQSPIMNYFGFGWDESSGAYKVFANMPTPEGSIAKVYSSNTNSWKTLEGRDFYISLRCKVGQFVGGKFHWISINNIICYFDLKTDMFGTIEQPLYPKVPCDRLLGVLRGCLYVVCDYSEKGSDDLMTNEYGVKMSRSITEFDVWVMMRESWLKLDTVSHVKELVQQKLSPPFALGQDEEALIITNASNFLVYRPQDSDLRPFKVIERYFRALVYVESLVSPGH